jgi:hypothetical protein
MGLAWLGMVSLRVLLGTRMGLWSLSPMGMGPPLGRLGLASPLVTGPQWSSGSRSTDGAGLMLVESALANDVGHSLIHRLAKQARLNIASNKAPANPAMKMMRRRTVCRTILPPLA